VILLNEMSQYLSSQPITFGILPMEVNKIMINDNLMPGLTKILEKAHLYPQLNWSPNDSILWEDNFNSLL
jgi:hypothetical protein